MGNKDAPGGTKEGLTELAGDAMYKLDPFASAPALPIQTTHKSKEFTNATKFAFVGHIFGSKQAPVSGDANS